MSGRGYLSHGDMSVLSRCLRPCDSLLVVVVVTVVVVVAVILVVRTFRAEGSLAASSPLATTVTAALFSTTCFSPVTVSTSLLMLAVIL